MNIQDILDHIVDPVLTEMKSAKPAVAKLVIGTGLAESGFREIAQKGGGPALSPWQIEPATHDDHWKSWLKFRPVRADQVLAAAGIPRGERTGDWRWLPWNWRYACAMCRVHYLRIPHAIPEDVEGQAAYWKKHYNTPLGAGTVEHYLEAWKAAGL